MKRIRTISIVLAMVLAIFASNAEAARKTIANVPYIHQVQDMDQGQFLGYNACGPTSAVMMVFYHKLQQGMCPAGYYVYNSYVSIPDKEGNYYDDGSARDWDGDPTPNTYNLHHPHFITGGAHGFIVRNSRTAANPYWGVDTERLENYLENHGLTVKSIYIDRFKVIQQNIDAGLSLIGHSYVAGHGHFLVIVGYDTGVSGNEQNVIVHDPYGSARSRVWNGSNRNGENVTYPLSGSVPYLYYDEKQKKDITKYRSVRIDYVITIHPIGVYNQFPGWRSSPLE